MNAPNIGVQVVQRYVPAIQSRIPSYGVASATGQLLVCLSDKAPVELVPLLEAELRAMLIGFVPASPQASAQYAERLTHDFLNAHVVSGNLRYDKVTSTWRWLGPR